MPAMKSIIQFTCPQCGGHQLMLVERAMHRYVVQSLEADRQEGCLSDTRFWWTIYAESRWGTAARTAVIRIAMGMIHRKDFNGIP